MPSFQEPPATSSLMCGFQLVPWVNLHAAPPQNKRQKHARSSSESEMPSHASTFEAESYHLECQVGHDQRAVRLRAQKVEPLAASLHHLLREVVTYPEAADAALITVNILE